MAFTEETYVSATWLEEDPTGTGWGVSPWGLFGWGDYPSGVATNLWTEVTDNG